ARRLAASAGIDLGAIKGSGPRGRIVKADIEALGPRSSRPPAGEDARGPGAAAPSAPPLGLAPIPDAKLFFKPDDYEERPHDAMRKSIARRLQSAKTFAPHYYLTIDCRIDELLAARGRLNAASPKGEGGYKLSVNDFVVKAAAL